MDSCPKSHEQFVDFDKCSSLIESLHSKLDPARYDDAKIKTDSENLVESFRKTIDPYQEQPELLDPYLNDLILKLTSILSDSHTPSSRYHTVFKFLYQLIKVYGFKSIGKKFPHETDKLPLLVELLAIEDPRDKANWQTRFVLTVWLSIVILTPFDLTKFDSDPSEPSIAERIYTTLIKSLSLHDSCQHVTAFCLAKFFSRPDMLKSNEQLSKFIDLALDELTNVKTGSANSIDDIPLIGYLRTLSYMFKFFPRVELKLRCQKILNVALKCDIEKINRELVNHLIVKLIQRAGLALLPKRVSTWRYKRGSRILGHVTTNGEANEASSKPASEQVAIEVDEDSSEVNNEEEAVAAEYLEPILSILFIAAQNGQTKIRWSAAKGIARLASRLSRERASEVIDMVMTNFFEATSSEFAWHGGTLTLAEMSRNGLVLEEKLSSVIQIVGDAILYDRIKGSFAVGAHVREAACYVCWAMARTYEDHLLKPYISSISVNLLCTILFDRELQCRRAASATFQELVGRQGTFNEEGINILTHVDYQNVGQRQFAYLHLAPQVASYGKKYSEPFVRHLLDKKVGHWDPQIRRLASDSLSALMLHSDHHFVRTSVLPQLIKMIDQNLDNNSKHGAILTLAKIIRGLGPLQFEFDAELIEFVGNIVEKCDKQLKSKQQAPNFMEAIGCLVSSAEIASFNYADESDTLKQLESIAFTALDSDSSALREIGSDALLTLYRYYYRSNKTRQDKILSTLNGLLKSLNESSRCGGLRALSKLSQIQNSFIDGKSTGIRLDADTPDIILMTLTSYIGQPTREPAGDLVFAQAKAEACEALVDFVRHVDKSRLLLSSNLIRASYDALLERTEDYTFDKRGDIGVVVRRASIKAIQDLTLHLLSIGMDSLFDSRRVTNIIARTLQQAVSYNNSARELAATACYKLIGCANLPESTIPHKDTILNLFDKYGVNDEFNWRDDSTPIFVSLLAKEEYSSDLWIGLLTSVGQVSEICARQFRDALSNYIQSLVDKPDELKLVFDSFYKTLNRVDMAERLLTSGLITADYLLTQGLLNETSVQFQQDLADFCWKSCGTNDPKRLVSVARVLSSMLQFSGKVQRDCLKHCLTLLANGYAKVRAHMAEQLYLSIMTYQSDLEANLGADKIDLDEAMELLSSTNWSEPLEKVKLIRDKICKCLAIQ